MPGIDKLSDFEFLEHLEHRYNVQGVWNLSREETLHLWIISGHRIPPPHVRAHYIRGREFEVIRSIRAKAVRDAMNRLTS